MRVQRIWVLSLLALPLAAAIGSSCSASSRTNGFDGAGGSGAQGGDGSVGSGSVSSGFTGGSGGNISVGSGSGGGLDEDAACQTVSSEAQSKLQPADIIIAVDTSGSMDEESAEVQNNLNNFATIIANSGVDAHVILIADSSVCIPMPLGSGNCSGADEKLPGYQHVDQVVASNNALQLIIQTYPAWKSSLRPGATKTIAVVSDDDSDMNAGAFTNALLALDPPTFQGFKFDAIVSSSTPDSCFFGGCVLNCASCANPCCDKATFCSPLSAAEGTVYKSLVQQTSGVLGDLCAQDFDPMFQSMATSVVQGAELSCDYDIPPPPLGEVLDPTKVNVNYTPGGGMPTPILNVSDPGACGVKGGWYYDNPAAPKKIIMCPTTCDTLKKDSSGKVDVLFGCATQVKPPE